MFKFDKKVCSKQKYNSKAITISKPADFYQNTHLRLSAINLSAEYNLSRSCSDRIYACLLRGESISKISETIKYIFDLLTSIGKNQFYINDVVYRILRTDRCLSSSDLMNLLIVFVNEGFEIEEVLEDSDFLSDAPSAELSYSIIRYLKDESIEIDMSKIRKLNLRIVSKGKQEEFISTYPRTNKDKFMAYAQFRNYIRNKNEKNK